MKFLTDEKKATFKTSSLIVSMLVGAGIYFKSSKVMTEVGGNPAKALLVLVVLAVFTLIYTRSFASVTTKYPKGTGITDLAEIEVGPTYSYFVGWFMATLYYPVISATVTYIAARYTCLLFDVEPYGQVHMAIAFLYMGMAIVYNSLASRPLTKKNEILTQIKILPLVVMGILGIIWGIKNGTATKAFTDTSGFDLTRNGGFFVALCAGVLVFEGWGISTTVHGDLKNSKVSFSRALMLAVVNCFLIYLLYLTGITLSMTNVDNVGAGDQLPYISFSNLFNSNLAGSIFVVFVIIACLATAFSAANACMKGYYHIARKNQGLFREVFSRWDSTSEMPLQSCMIGGLIYCFWVFQIGILYFNGPLITGTTGNPVWLLGWEFDEAIIINEYMLYIPVMFCIMLKEKDLPVLERFVLPILSIMVSLVLTYSWWCAYGTRLVIYHILFVAIVMGFGMLFYKKDRNISLKERLRREEKAALREATREVSR